MFSSGGINVFGKREEAEKLRRCVGRKTIRPGKRPSVKPVKRLQERSKLNSGTSAPGSDKHSNQNAPLSLQICRGLRNNLGF